MADYFSDDVKKEIERLSKLSAECAVIDPELYKKYDVKRGLRDLNGKGVVCGLTEISEIVSFKTRDGVEVPARGELYYRGYNINDIISAQKGKRYGFEKSIYLLLFGVLPTENELADFAALLSNLMSLPRFFVRDMIMKAPAEDIMNTLARGVLSLYPYDDRANDIGIPNVLRQVLQLLAQFPLLAVYGYSALRHYYTGGSLIIHNPKPEYSLAENILHLIREDGKFTELEAEVLDACLVMHAEHGGGNNSTFTMHVISSSGTDTYSAVAGALGSLKGPKHGGANIMVTKMFEHMKATLKNTDDNEIKDYLAKLLDKQTFDKAGLIYGMGHAVYSLSDPRADIMKMFVERLATEKNLHTEYELYAKVERLAPQIISEKRKIYKGVSCNVDFYSGLLYSILGIPTELYTPLFAIARMAGWGAHRIEELASASKIIRPDYKSVAERR